MKNNISVFLTIVLVLLTIISLGGCNSVQQSFRSKTKTALFDVYDSLEAGNRSQLKSLLSDYLKNKDDIDEQIDVFFKKIGGSLKSCNKESCIIEQTAAEKEFDEYVMVAMFGSIDEIIDANNNQYSTMVIHYTYVKTDASKNGIRYIALYGNTYDPICSITETEMETINTQKESSAPAIAPEQEKEISALEEKNHCMMPYRRAVASGDISPDSPKLTLDDTKRIIKEAENVESLNVRIYESGKYENYNQQAEYICQEISKIQPYADTIRSFGGRGSRELEYWITNDEATGERTQIHLTSGGMMICYEEIDKNGETKNSEVLFEASLEKNWQDSEENYPVITRPIVPDSASAE